jgi:hypothetical protein
VILKIVGSVAVVATVVSGFVFSPSPVRVWDMCREASFLRWPSRLFAAYTYPARHSAAVPLPGYMRGWHLR